MQRDRLTPDRTRIFTCPPNKPQTIPWDTPCPRLALHATARAGGQAPVR